MNKFLLLLAASNSLLWATLPQGIWLASDQQGRYAPEAVRFTDSTLEITNLTGGQWLGTRVAFAMKDPKSCTPAACRVIARQSTWANNAVGDPYGQGISANNEYEISWTLDNNTLDVQVYYLMDKNTRIDNPPIRFSGVEPLRADAPKQYQVFHFATMADTTFRYKDSDGSASFAKKKSTFTIEIKEGKKGKKEVFTWLHDEGDFGVFTDAKKNPAVLHLRLEDEQLILLRAQGGTDADVLLRVMYGEEGPMGISTGRMALPMGK